MQRGCVYARAASECAALIMVHACVHALASDMEAQRAPYGAETDSGCSTSITVAATGDAGDADSADGESEDDGQDVDPFADVDVAVPVLRDEVRPVDELGLWLGRLGGRGTRLVEPGGRGGGVLR